MFSVCSQTHKDCKKQQRAGSQDVEITENYSCITGQNLLQLRKQSWPSPSLQAKDRSERINRAGVGL